MNARITDVIVKDGKITMGSSFPSEYLFSSQELKKAYRFAGCISPKQAVGLQYVTLAAVAYRQVHQADRKIRRLNLGVDKTQQPYKLCGAVNGQGNFFLICDIAGDKVADIQPVAPVRATSLHHMFARLHSRRQNQATDSED